MPQTDLQNPISMLVELLHQPVTSPTPHPSEIGPHRLSMINGRKSEPVGDGRLLGQPSTAAATVASMTALDRLESAVRLLVAEHGTLTVRLSLAYRQHLRHIGPGDVPAELSGQLQDILDRFGVGDVGAHMAAMAPKAASRLALDIFELSCAVSQGLYH